MSFRNSPFSSGFPFDDRDFDRDRTHSPFRSQLDDLAKRHPEFAEHLNIGGSFPFRSHTLGRHPRRGSDTERPSGSQDAEFGRRHARDRTFPSFDFPFRPYFKPDFYETGYRVPPEYQPPHFVYTEEELPKEQAPHQQQQYQQQNSQPSSPQPSGNAEKPPQVPQPREGGRKQNIQQSNTVDLGQKQEPVDDSRGQRSMSAPPENRSTGQRFVSSINIPIQRPSGGGGDMGAKTSTQAQEPVQQQSNKPTERVIPIHVEGRDEPIIPKNVNTTFTQPPPQPQSERIFGRNPTHFTQYLNKGEPHGMTPEEHYRQQQQQFQKQQQHQQQQQQQQQQQHFSQPQQQQPQSQETQSQPESQSQPPPSAKQTQLDQIQNIQKDVSELMNQVEIFNGKPKDKQYLYLDEMLTRNLIKLDNIETEGKDNIRQARKEAIKCIEGCIGILEAKANANLAAETQKGEQKMEVLQSAEINKPQEEQVDQKVTEEKAVEQNVPTATNEPINEEQTQVESPPVALEVSGVTRTGSVINATATPMEVAAVNESEKEVPAPIPNEAQEKKEEVTLPTDTQQKPEEKNETKEKKDENIKNEEEIKNTEESKVDEKMETTPVTTDNVSPNTTTEEATAQSGTVSQNSEKEATSQEDKKEKKKGKKKEKTEKK